MDLYQGQIVEGDVANELRPYLPGGRIQFEGVPGRHEPDQRELHLPYVFQIIDALARAGSWHGWVGGGYRPARGAVAWGTRDGLGWLKPPIGRSA